MENLLGSLKRENKERERRLNISDRKLLSDMTGYMKTQKICDYDVELVRKTIIRDALRSYSRKRNLQTMAGDDYREFCDKLCENKRRASAMERIVGRGVTFIYALALMYAVRLIDVLIAGDNFWSHPVDINLGYLSATAAILIGTFFIYFYISHVLEGKSDKMSTKQTVILLLVLTAIIAVAYTGVYFFSDTHLFSVIWWIPIIILAIIFIVFRMVYIRCENQLAKES